MNNNLKLYRKEAGYTLQSLGNMCGLSKSYLYELEQGKSCPTLITAYAVARVFDIRIEEIWPQELTY